MKLSLIAAIIALTLSGTAANPTQAAGDSGQRTGTPSRSLPL